MTHRTDVEWINISMTFEEISDMLKTSQHSIFPVCEGTLDNTLGILRNKDFLNSIMMKVLKMIKRFKRNFR